MEEMRVSEWKNGPKYETLRVGRIFFVALITTTSYVGRLNTGDHI